MVAQDVIFKNTYLRIRLSFVCVLVATSVVNLLFSSILFAQSNASEVPAESGSFQDAVDRDKLRQSIDAQFEQLRQDRETEDAFSLELANGYFEYATLLSEAGYLEDSNSAFEKALHITKTNHGIDSGQQLPALVGIFNNYYTSGQISDAESLVVDVVRIEEKNTSIADRPSALMQLKLGHFYLEKLKNVAPESERGPEYVKLANKYFIAVIEQNKNKKLRGTLYPYGELAMATHLGNQLARKPEKVYTSDFELSGLNLYKEIHGLNGVTTKSHSAPIENIRHNEELDRELSRTLEILKRYFNKADAESNVEEALKATLALGDLNFLSNRNQLAKDYYAVAWAVAKLLPEDHPDRLALKQPTQLPAFKYAYNAVANQSELEGDDSLLVIPVQFDVNERGGIKNIQALTDIERKLVSKAKYELRKHPFRPAIVEGRLSDSQDYTYAVAVNLE